MRPYLLDVNVLLALAWPVHVHHPTVLRWFAQNAKENFRTCPMTQAGFVRISCNSSYSPVRMPPADATSLLDRILALRGHQ
ncbi:MAG: type II toxin-antitoxin system VapC family toxin, partial [Acidobacteriia bacterium]|nr:type II toxin-antitoxin system VapC family toxin [Terriglobia bacterium]